MTQQELAEALDLNQSQVSRYTRRGMPQDVAGAKAWLCTHVGLTMHAPAWRRQVRASPTPAAPTGPVHPAPELVAAAQQMSELAGQALDLGNGAAFDALVPAVRRALAAVPKHARGAVLLRFDVLDRLVAPLPEMCREMLAEATADGVPEPPMTDTEAAAMGAFWFALAAGEMAELPEGAAAGEG